MSNLCASCNINDDDCLYKLINCYVCAKPYHITRVDKDEAVFHALKTYKNLSWQCDECSGSQVVNNNDRGLELIMKKLESMSSEIDQLKEKTVPKSTFSGLFQENGDNLRGSKRSAILNGNGDHLKLLLSVKGNVWSQKCTLQRLSWVRALSTMIWLSYKPLKWFYVPMLHPDTTEYSVIQRSENRKNTIYMCEVASEKHADTDLHLI
jgi:hypothetical protein